MKTMNFRIRHWLGCLCMLAVVMGVYAAPPEVKQTGNTVFAHNRLIGVGFAEKNGALRLSSIADMVREHEYLQSSSPIWNLIFTNNGKLNSDNATGSREIRIESGEDTSSIFLYWRNMDLGAEKGVVDVEVVMTLQNGSPLSRWRINVKNRAAGFGLNRVEFPTVSCMGGGSEAPSDTLVYPGGWGKMIGNPETSANLSMLYPEVSMTMQFIAYSTKNNGSLYYASYDGNANTKFIRVAGQGKNNGIAINWSVIPENVNRPKVDFTMDYDMIIGVVGGDWYECAKIYRDWAVKQKWCAKGKIADRTDYSKQFRDTDVWMLHHAGDKIHPDDVELMKKARRATVFTTDESPKIISDFQEKLKSPIAVHWYLWHQIPFDNGYPDYFPAWDGFKPAVAKLKKNNIPVMPYINGRLWDTATESYKNENAATFAAHSGAAVWTEGYGGKHHAVMCPYTDFWRNKLNSIAMQLAKEYGVGGLYIDQIGAAFPRFCLNARHGHPTGGGHHWVDGYRAILTEMRDTIKKENPDFFFTTEGQAEPYIDLFEGSLMYNLSAGAFVPLFPTVYSQYASTLGNIYRMETSTTGRCALVAQSLIAGAQLGWVSADFMSDADFVGYLADCTAARKKARAFLMDGEMLKMLEPAGRNGLYSSVWRNRNGEVALVVTNPQKTAKTFDLKLNRADYGLASSGACIVTELVGDGTERKVDDEVIEESIQLPPYTTKVLLFAAQGTLLADEKEEEIADNTDAFITIRSKSGDGITMSDANAEIAGELITHTPLTGAVRLRLQSSEMKFSPEYIDIETLPPGEPIEFRFKLDASGIQSPGKLETAVVIEEIQSGKKSAGGVIQTSIRSLAYRKPYEKSEKPHPSYGDAANKEMTDGFYAGAFQDGKSSGFQIKNLETKEVAVIIDLGTEKEISHFRHTNCGAWNYYPDSMSVSVSNDKADWTYVGECDGKGKKVLQIDGANPVSGRYVEFKFTKTRNNASQDFMFIDELEVW